MMGFFDKFKQPSAKAQEWQMQLKRVEALPADYQIVFEEVRKYMLNSPDPTGYSNIHRVYQLIDQMEKAAESGKSVLEFTGSDIGNFAEGFGRVGNPNKDQLNQTVQERLEALNRKG